MGTVPVVAVKPQRQSGGALGRAAIGMGVGPFAQSGLDEAFGLAVGARGVGTGAQVA